eukprot:gene12690-14664_t
MSSYASPNARKIDENYYLDGGIQEDQLAALAKDCNSALYLYVGDSDAEEARQVLPKYFAASACLQLNSAHPVYQPDTASRPDEAIAAFKEFKAALDSLSRPVAIICKTATRASAVYAAYELAVKRNLTKEQTAELSKARELKYLGSAGLVAWVNTVIDQLHVHVPRNPLVFRQLFEKESSTYTYLLADAITKEAVLIDPVLETVARDSQLVNDLGLTLKYVLNTHVHADHITGSSALKALHSGLQSVISVASTGRADISVIPGQVVPFGTRTLTVLATPGHTEGCVSYLLDDMSCVFTGDALLVRGCGRTDFQGGSASKLYHSVHSQLFSLPDSTLVYPAHDYKGYCNSSILEERTLNPRLTKTLPEFVSIMDNLGLPYPAKFDKSVPANLVCGLQD